MFVEIECGASTYAVIIEDKIDSELHDQQTTDYIAKKAGWKKGMEKDDNGEYGKYAGIFYVLFKTGSLSFWELDYYKEEIEAVRNGKYEGHEFIKEKKGNSEHKGLFEEKLKYLSGRIL